MKGEYNMNYVSESALSDSYIYSMFNTNKSFVLVKHIKPEND